MLTENELKEEKAKNKSRRDSLMVWVGWLLYLVLIILMGTLIGLIMAEYWIKEECCACGCAACQAINVSSVNVITTGTTSLHPDFCNERGQTPLVLALRQSREKAMDKVISALLGAQADVNTSTKAGNTPLHRAAVSGHVEILEYLISLGADANLPNFSGNTPLHLATSTAVARALMAAGVDSSRKNNDRELPDQHAEKENRQAVAAAVRDYRELGFEMMSAKLEITAECDRAVMAARAAQVEAEDLTRGAVQQRDEEQAAKEEALAEVARLELELR